MAQDGLDIGSLQEFMLSEGRLARFRNRLARIEQAERDVIAAAEVWRDFDLAQEVDEELEAAVDALRKARAE